MLISVEGINNLVIYFQNTLPPGNVTPFEVKGVAVQLNSDINQKGTLSSSGQVQVQKNVRKINVQGKQKVRNKLDWKMIESIRKQSKQ